MTKRSRLHKARDREIDFAFRATCSGIPIKMTDIPKVFREGHRLIEAGATDQVRLRAGILAFVQTLTGATTP
jgi:hypothetical protein